MEFLLINYGLTALFLYGAYRLRGWGNRWRQMDSEEISVVILGCLIPFANVIISFLMFLGGCIVWLQRNK